MKLNPTLKRDGFYFVFVISGILGFIYGFLNTEYWQNAVEGAQVFAGLVHYPLANPFYIYQIKAWTLLHQATAVFLRFGAHEFFLSQLLSGLMGFLAFQVLSLIVFAFSGNRWSSLGYPFFIFYTGLYSFGNVYPLSLIGTYATYGAIGISWCMLALVLLCLGKDRFGALMLGMAPAVHITLGFFSWLIFLMAQPTDLFFSTDARPKRAPKYFLIGLTMTLLSFVIQKVFEYKHLPGGLIINRDFFSAIVKNWDPHRIPIFLTSEDFILNLTALFLFLTWGKFSKEKLTPEARSLLSVFAVAAGLGLVAMTMTWWPVEKMPRVIVAMMPARFLSFNHYAFGAVLLGMMERYRGHRTIHLFLIFFLLLMLCPAHVLQIGFGDSFALLIVAAILFFFLERRSSHDAVTFFKEKNGSLRVGIYVIVGIVALMSVFDSIKNFRIRAACTRDLAHDAVLLKASEQSSPLLLQADFGSIQFWTRRAVVLDVTALDGMAYIPEGSALVVRIMRDIYGVNLFHPQHARDIDHQTLWESRAVSDWEKLAKQYQFSEVLVSSSWKLKAPLVIKNSTYALYRIPAQSTEDRSR